jgi:hypothetical protein
VDLGERNFKNVDTPVNLYRLVGIRPSGQRTRKEE